MIPELTVAVVTFVVIIMLLASAIVLARSVLVPAGEVAVSINDGERELQMAVSQKLLVALAARGLFLPSACGGRGTCGQCRVKVLQGGGALLPTERALITPRQAAAGERLACQVTVREALRLQIPAEVMGIERMECTVQSNRSVATFIRELVLDPPPGTTLRFRAGNYIQIECPPHRLHFRDFDVEDVFRDEWDRLGLWELESVSGATETRAYSMANFPGEGEQIILNVRIATPPADAPDAPPGVVSSYVYSLKPGDRVAITGPFGEFVAKPTDREMVFIGGGAGMAPMRSHILDQLERLGSKRTISFWYGARNRRELFYAELFDWLAAKYENFEWHVALSDPLPTDNWSGPVGFIHQQVKAAYLERHPAPEACEYYVCGPPLMNSAVIAMLGELSVPHDQIAMDDFGSAEPRRRGRHGL